jgi:hypothetical protein
MNTGLLFPGQGSQRPQMLHDLVQHPVVDETLAEISEVLGVDIRTLDSTDALRSPFQSNWLFLQQVYLPREPCSGAVCDHSPSRGFQ